MPENKRTPITTHHYTILYKTDVGTTTAEYPINFTPVIPRIGEKVQFQQGQYEVLDVIHIAYAGVNSTHAKHEISIMLKKF